MTNANYIQWLETMIVGCDDLGGMEREKAIYQNCLKKARNLGQNLPIQRVSGSFSAVECKDLMYYGTLKDGSVKIDDGTKHLDYFLLNVFDLAKESTRFNVKEAIKMFWDRIEALANYR